MSDFKTTLKRLRLSLKLTQNELAQKLNLSRSSIGMYEGGAREPDYETLELIADFFNVDIDYLLGRTMKTTIIPSANVNKVKGVSIPVLGEIAAGIPIDAIEDILDYEEIPVELARTGEFFGLQIKGDSMEPKICEGDVVIIKKQEDVESGEVTAVLINGDSATCKKFVKHDNGISLISFNPNYSPKFFTPEEVQTLPVKILGKIVELRRKF